MKKNIPKKINAKKVANGYKLAPIVPEGTIFTDNLSNKWQLEKPIGSGGFGCLYSTKSLTSMNNDYVLKLEPAENGPLYCEINFYIRSAKPDMIKNWINENKINYLGIPHFVGSGQLEYSGAKYRFLVMPKFSSDLQKKFESNGKLFDPHTVFLLGYKMIDALQYIHEKGFAHADIKAANLMTGFKDPQNVYLIDYGLAFRYKGDSKIPEPYKLDPKWANNGTVEFTSRDAHDGAKPAPRGDLEILGYCMWQWLTGSLPWETNLTDLKFVCDQKKKYMADIKKQIGPLIKNKIASNEFCNYMIEIVKLNYTDIPKYNLYKSIFEKAIKSLGHKLSDKLSFDKVLKTPLSTRKRNGDLSSPDNNTPQSAKNKYASKKINSTPLSPSNRDSPPKKSKKEPSNISKKPNRIENSSPTSPNKSAERKRKATDEDDISPYKIFQNSDNLRHLNSNQNSLSNHLTTSNMILASTNEASPKKNVRKVSNKPKKMIIEKSNITNGKLIINKRDLPKTASLISSIGTQTSPGLAGLPRSRARNV